MREAARRQIETARAACRRVARVLAAVTDLFFKARITSVGMACGAEVAFATTVPAMAERAKAGPVDLVLVDLNAQGFDPLSLVRDLKREPMLSDVRIVAFLSHVQVDLKRAAEEAGVDEALPRSAFVARLPELLA